MIQKRYIQAKIEQDLDKKMVFVGGPRQVGKTTLSTLIGNSKYTKFSYLNWDNPEDKKKILSAQFDPVAKLLIFDEIHKYKKWKNYIKGQFDKYKERFSILVTGSARLDLYRKGGDSLMGRYYYYRLHPFSLAERLFPETVNIEPFSELQFRENSISFSEFEKMFIFGGFPEPLFSGDLETLRRWYNQKMDRLIKEDIRDIENVRDLSALQILAEILPSRVGSALSLNSLREDLEVAFGTIKLWMDILERFYYHFRIYPYSTSAIKSLRKEPKMYLWDWSQVPDEGAKLENMVGSHLLKLCHYLYDTKGFKAELFYLRDIEKKEVDFLVAVDKKPWMAIEVKTTDQNVSKNLLYFGKKLAIPYLYQLVKIPDVDFIQDNVRVMSVDNFLRGLV
ncbi:ATP-binding protein [Patescibacteria group bacterium]|nr:ATP-binding protein [Patescibacteria group bacterium]MBU4141308.1 ATP-binding protein [Patescibacteria group bacterium]